MFSLFNFSSIFAGGQLTTFAPMCGRPCSCQAVSFHPSVWKRPVCLAETSMSWSKRVKKFEARFYACNSLLLKITHC